MLKVCRTARLSVADGCLCLFFLSNEKRFTETTLFEKQLGTRPKRGRLFMNFRMNFQSQIIMDRIVQPVAI